MPDYLLRLDAASRWLAGPGAARFLGGRSRALAPALITLKGGGEGEEPIERARLDALLAEVGIAPVDDETAQSLIAGAPTPLIVYVSDDQSSLTQSAAAAQVVAAEQLSTPFPPPVGAAAAGAVDPPQGFAGALPPDKTIVGVIDDGFGLAAAHLRLGPPGSPGWPQSRVLSHWRQDAPKGQAAFIAGVAGPELFQPDIDAWLAAAGGDEAAFYADPRVAPYLPPEHRLIERFGAHGSWIAAEAAAVPPGADPLTRPLLLVQLPPEVVEQTSGASLAPYLLAGVAHIINRARQIDPKAPVVIVCAFGHNGGAHAGLSAVERGLDHLIARAGSAGQTVHVVLPSGNARQDRIHARFSLAPGASQDLTLRRLPDDRTPCFVEIWFAAAAAGALSVELIPPDGGPGVTLTDAAPGNAPLLRGAVAVASVAFDRPFGHGDRAVFTVAMQPTALDPAAPGAPTSAAGPWTIRIANLGGLAATDPIGVWVQRDDTLRNSRPGGRQAWLDDPASVRFDGAGRLLDLDTAGAVVRRDGAISGVACGAAVVVVGAWRLSDGAPALYSAGGPTQGRPGPTALAPGDEGAALRGLLGRGFFSGATTRLSGTSAAAACAARRLAAAAGKGAGPTVVDNLATMDEARGAPAGGPHLAPRPLPSRGGAGRLRRG